MKNEKTDFFIVEIEKVKQALTDAQKDIEDQDWHLAGTNLSASKLLITSVTSQVIDLFNEPETDRPNPFPNSPFDTPVS